MKADWAHFSRKGRATRKNSIKASICWAFTVCQALSEASYLQLVWFFEERKSLVFSQLTNEEIWAQQSLVHFRRSPTPKTQVQMQSEASWSLTGLLSSTLQFSGWSDPFSICHSGSCSETQEGLDCSNSYWAFKKHILWLVGLNIMFFFVIWFVEVYGVWL